MNRKIQMTKKLIREVLFECLKEKDINKITISSLCQKADINRPPFISIMVVNMMSLKKWNKKSFN